jgi:hypothetical protein
VRYYARFDLLIIDEFGFDKIERAEAPQAASLLYKVVDDSGRHQAEAAQVGQGSGLGPSEAVLGERHHPVRAVAA